MNYMEQVAEILGVELNEEFYIEDSDYKYKITKDGMKWYCELGDYWNCANYTLGDILSGIRKIKKPILDEAEKEYLRNIIKPFRGKLKSIIRLDFYWTSTYIQIEYDRDLEQIILKSDTMYNNMKLGKEYSLEELGL